MIEGFWCNDELIEEFIMINKKGNVFIGQKVDKNLKGTFLKKSKLLELKNLSDLNY